MSSNQIVRHDVLPELRTVSADTLATLRKDIRKKTKKARKKTRKLAKRMRSQAERAPIGRRTAGSVLGAVAGAAVGLIVAAVTRKSGRT